MQLADLRFLRQLGSGVVGFTAFVVLGLAAWIWSTAATAPEALATSINGQGANTDHGSRSLASIPPPSVEPDETTASQTGYVPKLDAKIETVTLASCLRGGNQKLQTTARHVRLKVIGCHGATNLAASQLVNLANGYEGTLFNLDKGNISSDYIHLIDGENKLVLSLEDAKGNKIASEVTILRRSGS